MLASDIKGRFQCDGFVFPIDVMDSAAVAAYQACLEAAEMAFPDLVNAKTCLARYPILVLPFIDEISRPPAVTDAVAAILGEDFLALDCPFFIMEVSTDDFVSWQ